MRGLPRYSNKMLRHKIRVAEHPDNPALITTWLIQEPCCSSQQSYGICSHCTAGQQFNHYENQCRLLMETAFDGILPTHWRVCCLDQVYKPLCELRKLAASGYQKQRLTALDYELFICSHYFGNSFH